MHTIRESYAVEGRALPTVCECDSTHQRNGTVCAFCQMQRDDAQVSYFTQQQYAFVEGWGLFRGPATERWRILRLDDPEVVYAAAARLDLDPQFLTTDAEAESYVIARAAAGSEFHKAALRLAANL